MNIITRASVKERIHVEQIIRSQPHMHNSGLVDIVTIPVRKCLGLSMDVYKPVEEVKEPLPIILDIHGGGLIAGRKEQNRNLGIQLARRGYIVFIPDYRLVPETDIFGQISDILDALAVIEAKAAEFGGNIEKLFVTADGRQFEMRLYHYDNSNDDDDLGLDIVMTQSQYDAVLQRFEEQYKKAYGVSIERGWKDSLFDCGENEEEEI